LQFKIGRTWQDQGQYERASQAFNNAEKTLGKEPVDDLVEWWQTWIWIQYNRLLGYYAQAKPDQIADLVAALQPAVEQYGTPQQHNAFYGSQARMYFRRDRYVISDELLTLSRKQLMNALEIGEKQRIGEAHFELGLTLLLYGELEEAEIELQRSLRVAEQCSNLYNQTLSLTYLTILSRKLNQLEDARAYASRSIEMATKREMVDYIATAKANLAWVSWKEGDLDNAETNGQEALDLWGRVPYLYPFQWTAFWPLLAVALERDRLDLAVECAQGMLAPEQQRLPDGINMALDSAIQSSARDRIRLTRRHLEQAVDLAKNTGYL
jgi:tetratricopeptide (TPR) repeat protein